MLAWSSCIIRCRIRCEPVRCTSTFTPGYAVSKSLATFSELVSASEVYQTTLPPLRAASSRASCAAVGAAQAIRAETNRTSARRRCLITTPLGGEGVHQGREPRLRGERVHERDHARGLRVGNGLRRVGAELGGELLAGHRGIGPPPRCGSAPPRSPRAAAGSARGGAARSPCRDARWSRKDRA